MLTKSFADLEKVYKFPQTKFSYKKFLKKELKLKLRQIKSCNSVHPDLAATMGSFWSFAKQVQKGEKLCIFILARNHMTRIMQTIHVHQDLLIVIN